jgi:hypothetical protein
MIPSLLDLQGGVADSCGMRIAIGVLITRIFEFPTSLRLMIDGASSPLFSALALPPCAVFRLRHYLMASRIAGTSRHSSRAAKLPASPVSPLTGGGRPALLP